MPKDKPRLPTPTRCDVFMTFVMKGGIKSWQRSLLACHSLVLLSPQRTHHASSTVLGAGFLFLYQRVGSSAQETVNKMLRRVSACVVEESRGSTYQRAIAMPHTVLAWKQLVRVTPAQWRRSRLEPDLFKF
jgi:hypothetical protein